MSVNKLLCSFGGFRLVLTHRVSNLLDVIISFTKNTMIFFLSSIFVNFSLSYALQSALVSSFQLVLLDYANTSYYIIVWKIYSLFFEAYISNATFDRLSELEEQVWINLSYSMNYFSNA